MKRLILALCAILATSCPVWGQGIILQDIDGSPIINGVIRIRVTNGTLANNGGGTATLTLTGGSGISDIVEDTTPQLGGDLDLNGNVITGLEIGTDIQAVLSEGAFVDGDKTKLDAVTTANIPTADEKAGLAANSPTAGNPVITSDDLTPLLAAKADTPTFSDLNSGTELTAEAPSRHFYDAITANRTFTISNPSIEDGEGFTLHFISDGNYTLTFPSFQRLGESSTSTTVPVYTGYNEYSLLGVDEAWWMVDSAGATGVEAFDAIKVHGADVASASTIDLDAATGDLVDVTGTTTITAVTLAEGDERTIRFTGTLTLTDGASLVLPTGENITTAAGDYAIVRGYGSGVVRVVAYSRADGTPLAGGGGLSNVVEDTTPQLGGNLDLNGNVITGLEIGTNVQAYDAALTTWAGVTPGTGVATALAVNAGSTGAFVVQNGALGTPASGTLTNATGLPVSTGVSGLGTGVATAAAANVNETGGLTTKGYVDDAVSGAGGGAAPFYEAMTRFAVPTTSGAAWNTFGINPATSGTLSEIGDTDTVERHLRYTSGATINNEAGNSSNSGVIHFSRSPTFATIANVNSFSAGVLRQWLGEFGGTPMAADDPAVHGAGFRYSTSASDTNFQCWTNDGSGGGTITDSGVAADANFHLFKVVVTSGVDAKFYIDGNLVATHTTNLPTGYCRWYALVRTLEGVAKSIDFKYLAEITRGW